MQRKNEIFSLVLESDSRIMRFYKETILVHFKKNSKDNNALSARQFFILYIILYRKINTITDISKYMKLSKANISILTTKLEEAGYVARNKQQDIDSRVSTLEVTDLGIEVYNETNIKIAALVTEKIEKYESGFPGFIDLLFNMKKCLSIDESINDPETVLLLVFIKLDSIYEDIYNRILAETTIKISIAEIKIIKLLSDLDNVNFETLTRYTALSYSTLSLQVKSLVDRGFIEKVKSKEDGRITYLELTDLGVEVDDFYEKTKGDVIASYLADDTIEHVNFAIETFTTLFRALDTVEPVWM